MYAKLNIRVGMNDLILYNERKVAGGKANCIYAGNFLKDAEDLSKADKQDRFRQLWQINQESPRWAVSAVLQFSPVDKLPQDDLIDIGSYDRWVLQLHAVQPVRVFAGMRIGQVTFWSALGATAAGTATSG